MFRVAIVCEGPTDRAILEAILDHYLMDYEPLPLQPPQTAIGGDNGPFGGGWRGVQRWCEQEGRGHLDTVHADLLIVQVDADVATELECASPCPPPETTTTALREVVMGWLGLNVLPDDVVLCVPSMASETWALVAIFPGAAEVVPCEPPPADGQCIECRTDIKSCLRVLGKRLRPKLVEGGELKNNARGYEQQAKAITTGWPRVLTACGQAARFDRDVRPALGR